jgi:hypothetical protein
MTGCPSETNELECPGWVTPDGIIVKASEIGAGDDIKRWGCRLSLTMYVGRKELARG